MKISLLKKKDILPINYEMFASGYLPTLWYKYFNTFEMMSVINN